MTCEERQRHWNDLLDARDGGSASSPPEWDRHLDDCERCRSLVAGFETLRDAIDAWPTPRAGSGASSARLVWAGRAYSERIRARSRLIRAARIAIPAGLAASLIGISWFRPQEASPPRSITPVVGRRFEARPLALAIREARTATRELAGEATGPATRIGREVLGIQAEPPFEVVQAVAAPEVPKRTAEAVKPGESRVPFSDSARHAFGFLLGPEGPPPRETSSGL